VSFLVVLCEGETEMDFVGALLTEHLSQFGIRTRPILLGKKLKRDVATAPGGVFKYGAVYRHITASLRQYSSETSHVTTMLDLYAFPTDFPDYEDVVRNKVSVTRAVALETAMRYQVNSPRFIPHIQLHEFEALVLSKREELKPEFEEPLATAGVAALDENIGALAPEEIDQTVEGAPSKRLSRFLPGYRKREMGVSVTRRIGWEHLRTACPHFGSWLQSLEALGNRPAGAGAR